MKTARTRAPWDDERNIALNALVEQFEAIRGGLRYEDFFAFIAAKMNERFPDDPSRTWNSCYSQFKKLEREALTRSRRPLADDGLADDGLADDGLAAAIEEVVEGVVEETVRPFQSDLDQARTLLLNQTKQMEDIQKTLDQILEIMTKPEGPGDGGCP